MYMYIGCEIIPAENVLFCNYFHLLRTIQSIPLGKCNRQRKTMKPCLHILDANHRPTNTKPDF